LWRLAGIGIDREHQFDITVRRVRLRDLEGKQI
jgi:hypothetical protein